MYSQLSLGRRGDRFRENPRLKLRYDIGEAAIRLGSGLERRTIGAAGLIGNDAGCLIFARHAWSAAPFRVGTAGCGRNQAW